MLINLFSVPVFESPSEVASAPERSAASAASEAAIAAVRSVSESRVIVHVHHSLEDLLGPGDGGFRAGEFHRDGAVHDLVVVKLTLGFLGIVRIVVDHCGSGERPSEVVLVDFTHIKRSKLVEHLEQVVARDVGMEPNDPELSAIISFSWLLWGRSLSDNFNNLSLLFE